MCKFERLQLWGNQFGQQASGSNFEAQLSGAVLQNGFGEPFLVQTRSLRAFGEQLLALIRGEAQWNIFAGATAKKNRTAALPHKPSLNGSFVVMASLGSRFRKPLWIIAWGEEV